MNLQIPTRAFAAPILGLLFGLGLAGPASSAPQQDVGSLFDDPEAVELGARMLNRLYDAAGGLEAWKEGGGLRIELLDTTRHKVDKVNNEWVIFGRVPRLLWFDPAGRGWMRSEFVTPDRFDVPAYRREVCVDQYAWYEADGAFARDPEKAQVVRGHYQRAFFLTAMPFSLDAFGASMVHLRRTPGRGPGMGPIDHFAVRLNEPVFLHRHEPIQELVLRIDSNAARVVQMAYQLTGLDKITTDESSECFVDFEGELTAGDLKFYEKTFWFYELDMRIEEGWMAAPVIGPPPLESLRRPWQTGEIWATDLRATAWDPPVAEGEPAVGPEEDPGDGPVPDQGA